MKDKGGIPLKRSASRPIVKKALPEHVPVSRCGRIECCGPTASADPALHGSRLDAEEEEATLNPNPDPYRLPWGILHPPQGFVVSRNLAYFGLPVLPNRPFGLG